MDAASLAMILNVAVAALGLIEKAAQVYPEVRDALDADTKAQLDPIYDSMVARSNAVTENLRGIPDDQA